jgi:hypothetical protein
VAGRTSSTVVKPGTQVDRLMGGAGLGELDVEVVLRRDCERVTGIVCSAERGSAMIWVALAGARVEVGRLGDDVGPGSVLTGGVATVSTRREGSAERSIPGSEDGGLLFGSSELIAPDDGKESLGAIVDGQN